jgi:hypothetical protein
MLNKHTKLKVLLTEDDILYTDLSNQAANFQRGTISSLTEDSIIYIGYYKPISNLYIDLKTKSDDGYSLSVEKFVDGSWESVEQLTDETEGLVRSGFVTWKTPDQDSDQESSIIDNSENYWIKITHTNLTGIEINVINLIFADDDDLIREFPGILDSSFLIGERTDHLLTHQAVRNDILNLFAIKGIKKSAIDSEYRSMIQPWDLLDLSQLNTAATYLALSKIFNNVSDSPDDIWRQKADYYYKQYQERINIALLTIDRTDTGLNRLPETDNKRWTK